MSSYWLTFVDEQDDENPVLAALTVPLGDRNRLGRHARVVLAAADLQHDQHRASNIAFLADVTHWLQARHHLSWTELDVDLDAATTDLRRAPGCVVLDASPLAMIVAATGGRGLDQALAAQVVAVRRAIDSALRAPNSTSC